MKKSIPAGGRLAAERTCLVADSPKKAKKKSRPENKATKLMKAMGSSTGAFDPEPPDQWKYDLRYGAPDDRYVAWVKSKTVAVGHMTPYATAERGPFGEPGGLLTLRDAREELGYDRKHMEHIARETDRQGRTRRDPRLDANGSENTRRRIWLCAEVAEIQKLEESTTYGKSGILYNSSDSPFIRSLPEHVSKQILAWSDAAAQKKMEAALEVYDGWRNLSLAEAMQGARAMTDRVLQAILEAGCDGFRVKLRPDPVKKKGRPKSERAAQTELFDWRKAQTSNMTMEIVSVPAAIRAILPESLQAPVQTPLEPAEAPAPPVPETPETGLLYTTENRFVQKENEPVSLLCSDPDSVGIRETVEIRETVRQSHADRPTKAQAETQKAGEKKTPPMKAATRPEPASEDRSAILDDPEEKKAGTPAARPASKEHTGLAGTPSIEHRRRLKQISDTIPDELAERLGENKHSLPLLKQIEFALRGSTQLDLLSAAIAKADRAGKFHPPHGSLGLIISLAVPIGENWIRGAPEREKQAAAAERARVAEQAEQQKRGLLAEYSRHNEAAAEALYRALKPVDLGERQTAVKAQLRREGRLQRMALDVQAREIKQLILLDLARALPTFDEWRHQTKGATS